MKHVFVETNFLVDFLRPFPAQDAETLFARNRKDVTLYVPWVSLVKRTLDRIIKEDLGFPETMLRHAGRQSRAAKLSNADHAVLSAFARASEIERSSQLTSVVSRVDSLAKQLIVIELDKDVIEKTLGVLRVKSLPPFDEMARYC